MHDQLIDQTWDKRYEEVQGPMSGYDEKIVLGE